MIPCYPKPTRIIGHPVVLGTGRSGPPVSGTIDQAVLAQREFSGRGAGSARRRRGGRRTTCQVGLRDVRDGGPRESMIGFVSSITNRIDRKGRVSVPAAFRQVLARDGYEGLYCYPSIDMQAIDAGGNGLLAEIDKRLARFEPFTEDHDYLSTAFFGVSQHLTMDSEGRVGLTETLIAYAGIVDEVTFVGQGYKFQLWEPSRFRDHEAEARRRALILRKGSGSSFAPRSGEGAP
jgi:MraZ protein